eukprot:9847-Pleurochrysis_carterae.AAC.1
MRACVRACASLTKAQRARVELLVERAHRLLRTRRHCRRGQTRAHRRTRARVRARTCRRSRRAPAS